MKFESDQDWCDVATMRSMTIDEYRGYIDARVNATTGVLSLDGGPPLACNDEQLEYLAEMVNELKGRLVL